MKLGICTRYCFHESTYAGIRIANLAVEQGQEVSILTMTNRPRKVDRQWDSQVHNTSQVHFTTWLEGCDTVVWTSVPHIGQVEWAKRHGRKTCIFVLWHELREEDREVLRTCDVILAPTMIAAKFLSRKWKLRNIAVLPWDVGLPICCKPRDYIPMHPKILMPLYDGVARRMQETALSVAARALACHPKASLSVIYNSSTIASHGKRKLKELKKIFPDRLSLYKGVHPNDRPLLFRQHDLTFWPTHWESTCMVGLLSITMGTPVVAFNYQPTDEFFVDGINSFLVEAPEATNSLGLPCVDPDYTLMDDVLRYDALDVERLYAIQQTVSKGICTRRDTFVRNIKRALA